MPLARDAQKMNLPHTVSISKETLHTLLYGLVMKQIKTPKKNPVKPIAHIYPAMNHT